MNNVFFEQFLMVSDIKTILFIAILLAFFSVIYFMAKKKLSFGKRVTAAMVLGLALGIIMQFMAGYPESPSEITFINEATTWYGLFGNGFMSLIRMLVVPLVMVSIIHVIINMKEDAKIGKLVRNTIIVTMSMVAVAVVVGLIVGVAFNIGAGVAVEEGTAEIKEVSSIVATLNGLLPSNPAKAMVDVNIIALVIFSMFFGIGARRMSKKYMDVVKPFHDLINALHKIIISIAMSIIKLMPYAVIPLLANTIALRGLSSIAEVGVFIVALYIAVIIMFVLQLVALIIFGINPIYYLRKSIHVMILAFTSRSSVGTLPVTIDTLTNKLGVNDGTASFVAGFGTTAGMQGCAGVFPALLLVFVANMGGVSIDVTFIVMTIIVVSIGSLGIAGIPGTATMAASVSLSGMGMSASFSLISPILAIDPLIDMGRTLLNVTGSMVNSIIVDKMLGQFNKERYTSMKIEDVDND